MADIQQLLQDANVDFRDCYEKSELINRLKEYEKQLPVSVRNRLRFMTNSEGDSHMSGSNQTPAHHSYKQRLFSDEQYVVNVFNVSLEIRIFLYWLNPQGSQYNHQSSFAHSCSG